MSHVSIRSLSIIVLALCASSVEADDWPQWRGPRLDGTMLDGSLSDARTLAFDPAWRRPLGSGYSSVSVTQGLGVTMASIDDRDWVVAFDAASGDERWRFDLGNRFHGRSGADDGPMSTPAIAAGLVFALSAEGRFVAVDVSSGDLTWERDLAGDYGAEPDFYGYSTAPMVHRGRVFLLAGGSEGRMLIAFDARSGRDLWKTGADQVQHQNLVVTRLGGIEQVVAPGHGSVSGFATEDGRVLWRHDFEEEAVSGGVVPIDESRVLVTRWGSTHLLEVESNGEGQSATEVWGNENLGSTYAVPVRRGDHLYGFNRRFLTCLELATGELVWRSRPPGGQGLIGIDDHLLIVADDGQLVSVAASPEGYRETGRLELFARRRVLTPPSFAGERLFVRDLGELVAVDVRPAGPALASSSGPMGVEGEGALVELLARIGTGTEQERSAAVDTLGESYDSMPVLEGGRAHFLYRGEMPDLAIVGDMTGAHREVPMRRLGDSDWYHESFPAPAEGRWEYQYKVFSEALLDPMNASTVETPGGDRSVVSFGDDDGSAAPPACQACPRGDVESHEIQSTVPERSYELSVYTPPGYDPAGSRRYPAVFWAEGRAAQQFGEVAAWLDGLIARGEVEPLVGIFLELPEAAWWEQSRDRFEEVMDKDVMPFLESEYLLTPEGGDRSLIAQGWSAGNMLLWGLERGLGNIAVQSPFFGEYFLDREVPRRIESAQIRRLYADWGSFDQINPDWGMDVAAQSRRLVETLESTGVKVGGGPTPGGANWTRWSSRTGDILRFFHPSGSEDR